MSRFLIPFLAALCLAACDGPSDSAGEERLQDFATGPLEKLEVFDTPKPLPDLMIRPGTGDDEVPLSEAVPGPALINLWATWCAPCVKELPALARLSEITDLPVYALNIERGRPEKIAAFLEEKAGETLILLRDPMQGLPVALEASGVPITVAVNADGLMVAVLYGEADWDYDMAIAFAVAISDKKNPFRR